MILFHYQVTKTVERDGLEGKGDFGRGRSDFFFFFQMTSIKKGRKKQWGATNANQLNGSREENTTL